MIFGKNLSGASLATTKSGQVRPIAKLAPHLQKIHAIIIIIIFYFILFYTKTRCIQRLERNKLKKTSKPIQT